MKEYEPLTDSEVNEAAKEFFPLFDIVHRNMPENCTVEDTLKVMETVCSMAQKRRAFDKEEVSCLKEAIKLGGKIRVGFENSLLMPDGSIAPNNETKVKAASSLFD